MRKCCKLANRRAATIASVLVAIGLVVGPSSAFASEKYPVYLQEELMLPAEPPCTLCHATDDGGKDTATKPFGFAVANLGVGRGSSRRTVVAALHESEELRMDSDGDGVSDVDEIRMGEDPNLGVGGVPQSTLTPTTGCGIGRTPSGASHIVSLLAIVAGFVAQRRRGRRRTPGAPLVGLLLALLSTSRSAFAAPQDAGDAAPVAEKSAKPELPREIGEFGVFGGVLLSDSDPELAGSPDVRRSFTGPASSLGARLLFLPLSVGGIEGEFDHTNATTRQSYHLSLWQLRAHVFGQLPLGVVTPFALFGLGNMRAVGPTAGDHVEGTLQYGAGLKLVFDPSWLARLDVRDTVTDSGSGTRHHAEILFGLTLVLRPPRAWSSP